MFLDYSELVKTGENVERKISNKMEEYATSFTIHGLSKIYTGNPLEKLIWITCVLVALVCCGLITSSYATKYRQREIYQNVLERAETKAYFPQVTSCVLNLHPLFCEQYNICSRNIPEDQPWSKSNSSFIWSNDVFVIEALYSKNVFKFYNLEIKPGDIISHKEVNGSCITWHGEKKLYHNPFRMGNIVLNVYVPKAIAIVEPIIGVTIEEQNVSGILQIPQYAFLEAGESVGAQLSKTIIIRKANPFPSKCMGNMEEYNFPGLYNQKVCRFIKNTMKYLKEINGVLSFIESLVDKNLLNKYFAEQHCPFPCEETRYDISWKTWTDDEKYCKISNKHFDIDERLSCVDETSNENTIEFAKFSLELQFKHPEFLTIIEEKELYPLQEMLGEIGGFLGLMIGASCMSLLELIIYLILSVTRKLQG